MTSGILSPMHLLIVLLVALIVLGPKRLPGAGRALGHGLREFKDSISGIMPNDEPAAIPAPSAGSEVSMAATTEPAMAQTAHSTAPGAGELVA